MFRCGMEQDNSDSPRSSILVIMFKHRARNLLLENMKPGQEPLVQQGNEYTFHFVDYKDGVLTVQRLSYCDDNTIFRQNRDQEVLTKMAQDYINRTGMLSIVLKIGRCGHKCDLTFFNMDPLRALNLPKFTSAAWSFLVGKPVLEVIPTYVRFSPQHARLIADQTSFSTAQSARLLKLAARNQSST